MIGRSHMNTHQGGGTSQGRIISIKRHFANLVFWVFFMVSKIFGKALIRRKICMRMSGSF